MAGKKTEAKKEGKKATTISKAALVNALAESVQDVSRKHVKAILEALADVAYKELKKAKVFTLPGFAKFRIVEKKATPARMGRHPQTGAPMQIAAKPKSKAVRARPIKAIKEAVA